MKHPSLTYLLLLLMALTPACRHDNNPAPLQFTAYENNPILGPGEPGAWDDFIVLVPSALRHENVIYLFYSGWHKNGQISIGLATSKDGYHFEKYSGQPVLHPSETGFDSYHINAPVFLREDSAWVMYYNAAETAIYCPGPFVGRATARKLTGPWERLEQPILSRGHKSEWDGSYVFPSSILQKEDGTYMLFFTGGLDLATSRESHIGLATSEDGIHWIKYNDASTSEHPFADSDPLEMNVNGEKIPYMYQWSAVVLKTQSGFEMYFGQGTRLEEQEKIEFGYATSSDAIHWEQYPGNPYYSLIDDPVSKNNPAAKVLEFPTLVFTDSLCLMYYDYGHRLNSIGVATALLNN